MPIHIFVAYFVLGEGIIFGGQGIMLRLVLLR